MCGVGPTAQECKESFSIRAVLYFLRAQVARINYEVSGCEEFVLKLVMILLERNCIQYQKASAQHFFRKSGSEN